MASFWRDVLLFGLAFAALVHAGNEQSIIMSCCLGLELLGVFVLQT